MWLRERLAVTTPAPTSTTVPLSCPPKEVGRCATCRQPCHRYGHGANPLSLGVDQLLCDVG